MSENELLEMEEWYKCGLLAYHDKGETAERDIPKLLSHIRSLEIQVKRYENALLEITEETGTPYATIANEALNG